MEPKLPTPNIGPEWSPVSYSQNLEHAPPAANPENTIEQNLERLEHQAEATSAPMPVLPAPVALPLPSVTSDDTTPLMVSNTPLVANNDDLIEKEWVDQAKKIILQTKDDPYRREQEVAKLQADYLLKRYGRKLGAS